MNLKALKLIGTGFTIVGGVIGIVGGVLDQKIMVAEVTKQVAEALSKK